MYMYILYIIYFENVHNQKLWCVASIYYCVFFLKKNLSQFHILFAAVRPVVARSFQQSQVVERLRMHFRIQASYYFFVCFVLMVLFHGWFGVG